MEVGGKYILNNTILGNGSFSTVIKGYIKKNNELIAIKKIKKNSKINIKHEINILNKVYHKNICNMIDYLENDDSHYIILELCDKTLDVFLKETGYLRENKAKTYFRHIAAGLEYLQELNIVHRDIKPQNLLITYYDEIKISDFGLSKIIEDNEVLDTLCGSPLYMAPEIMKTKKYDNKIDLWSSGVVLFQMLFNKTPYTAKNHFELLRKIDSNHVSIPSKFNISDDCKDILKKLLVKNPKERIEWNNFFIHPFIYEQKYLAVSKPIPIPKKINNNNILSFSPSKDNTFKIVDTPLDDFIPGSLKRSFEDSLLYRMKDSNMFNISYSDEF